MNDEVIRLPAHQEIVASGPRSLILSDIAAPPAIPQDKLFQIRLMSAVLDALEPDHLQAWKNRDRFASRQDPPNFPVWDAQLFHPAPNIEEPNISGADLVYTHNPDRIDSIDVSVKLDPPSLYSEDTMTIDCDTIYKTTEVSSCYKGNPRERIMIASNGIEMVSTIPLATEDSSALDGKLTDGRSKVPDMIENLINTVMMPEGFTVVDYNARHPTENQIKVNTSSGRIGDHFDMGREKGMHVTWNMEINKQDIPALRAHLKEKLNQVELTLPSTTRQDRLR